MDRDAVKEAVKEALNEELGTVDEIKEALEKSTSFRIG